MGSLLVVMFAGIACGGGGVHQGRDAAPGADGGGGQSAQSLCRPIVQTHPLLASPHILAQAYDEAAYNSNPPSSGPHCAAWGKYATFTGRPLPRCNYLHNLEHGAVVFLFKCPQGCPEVTAAFAGLIAGFQHDQTCAAPRLIVTPDAELPTKVAASAWGATFTAECLDEAALAMLAQFTEDFYNQAPEDVCSGGTVAP